MSGPENSFRRAAFLGAGTTFTPDGNAVVSLLAVVLCLFFFGRIMRNLQLLPIFQQLLRCVRGQLHGCIRHTFIYDRFCTERLQISTFVPSHKPHIRGFRPAASYLYIPYLGSGMPPFKKFESKAQERGLGVAP
jgi:hypothetical protein